MRVIGVTGGVGAGKSTVLGILEEDFQAYVIQADQLGHILMEPGEECYDAVIALFGKEIIKKDKTIDRRRISDVVFTDKDMLLKLNGIIHPAVKQRILDLLGEQKEAGREICVVEAALFLEENYQEFCAVSMVVVARVSLSLSLTIRRSARTLSSRVSFLFSPRITATVTIRSARYTAYKIAITTHSSVEGV